MKPREMRQCHDCGAMPGFYHILGCDVERCVKCGRQLISCGCNSVRGLSRLRPGNRMIWTGEWPGLMECREFNFWCKWVDGSGLVKCDKDDPEATENLNRLHEDSKVKWNRKLRRFIRK